MLHEDTAPQEKDTAHTQFLAHLSAGKMAGRMKTPLGREVGLHSGEVVLDGTELSTQKEAQPPFSADVYYGQTARCISMPFGTVVGLGIRDIVLDEAQLPRAKNKGATHPQLSTSIFAIRSPFVATSCN